MADISNILSNMEDEIHEYEKQLTEIREAKALANEEEALDLGIVETELVELLKELRQKLPTKPTTHTDEPNEQKTSSLLPSAGMTSDSPMHDDKPKKNVYNPSKTLGHVMNTDTNINKSNVKAEESLASVKPAAGDQFERGKSNWQKFARSGRVQKSRKISK